MCHSFKNCPLNINNYLEISSNLKTAIEYYVAEFLGALFGSVICQEDAFTIHCLFL